MPPSPPIRAANCRARASFQCAGSGASAAILCVLVVCFVASSAAADSTTVPETAAVKPPVRLSVVPVKKASNAPLLPQTRYTVRKQIESIEPVRWLERYGKVGVRELKP